jgi:phosphatidylinositol alpha-mannosyltransferase
MKIGLVCPYNMARGGGVQEIVRDMRAGLTELGHDVKIVTPQPRSIERSETDGIIFLGRATDFRSPMHTTPQFSVSVNTDEIEQMLAEEQFDILHFHEPWVPVLSRQILARSKAINIATFHAKVPETLMSRTIVKVVTPYTKSLLRYLHALTAVSDAGAEYASSLTDEPITIIPNGIDLKRFRKATKAGVKDPDVKTILYIGRLERRKGLKYLFRAYEQLTHNHQAVRLVIAGDGPDREKLEMLAQTMRLPNVSFLGFVTEQEKMELLGSADLFCSPAIFGESFGIVLLEAMASGLVTVAGDNSGYSAVMQEMGSLSLVNPNETNEFARRLELLLYESKLRADWQAWAKRYVEQYNYPQIITRYNELYEYTVKNHAQSKKAP